MRRILLLSLFLPSLCLGMDCEGNMPAANTPPDMPSAPDMPLAPEAPPTDTPPEMVLLDGFSVGGGAFIVDPLGERSGTGLLYPKGTIVIATAVANPGWTFIGWFGDIESLDSILVLELANDIFVSAFFIEDAPPPPPPVIGGVIIADNGQDLGVINTNRFDSDSIANPFGTFGSTFNPLSIWNRFGTYGGSFNNLSPYSRFTSTPPSIFVNGVFDSYLTKNTSFFPRVDPDDLARAVGRPEVARD